MRTDLAEHRHSPPPRDLDLVERRAPADVHHVRRCTRELGQHQEPVHALGLEPDRAAPRQRLGAELAPLDQLARQHVDDAAVLAVGQHDDAELGRLLHHPERDVVVGLDAELVVGEPELHAADPEPGDVAEIALAVALRLPDHRVERQVDQRLGHLVCERAARGLDRSLARLGVHEHERRGGPADERRARVVADGTEDMGVHVDRPGEDEASGRVEHLRPFPVDAPDLQDRAALDQDVRGGRRLRADDGAADDRGAPAHTTGPGRASSGLR